jgi:hypothetical protein
VATDSANRPPGVRLVPSHDVHALREAIVSALSEGEPRRQRTLVADETNLREVLKVYEELMA